MKIGIYITDIHPQQGGGYTFQENLLTALNESLSAKVTHTFFVFHYNESTIGPLYPYLTFVKLNPSLFLKIKNRIKRLFGKGHRTGWLDYVANLFQIDLIWFITYAFEEVSIPYVYTVWDLQHRLQPS